MTPQSTRIRRAAIFAILVTLAPLGYLLIWLFGNPEILGFANVFFALAAWGPALPVMNALGWVIGPDQAQDAVRVVLALAGWFSLSFLVRYLVRNRWVAVVIIIVLAVFLSALNVFLMLPYL